MDKLFFGEIEKQSKMAEAEYMSSRGEHYDCNTKKKISVAANPGTKTNPTKDDGGKNNG